MDREVALKMSEGEAAILFELLSGLSRADALATQSDRIVVWRTICVLEKAIGALFDPRCRELAAAARARIEAEGA